MALINTTTTGILGTTVYGDGQGALTVQRDGVTQGVYGNIPTFRAYKTTTQSLTSGSGATLSFEAVSWDTTNSWNASTNRYTPNVAGYYMLIARVNNESSSGGQLRLLTQLTKSGGPEFARADYNMASAYQVQTQICSGLVYLNGTTDYVQVTGYSYGTGPIITPTNTVFEGFLFKAA